MTEISTAAFMIIGENLSPHNTGYPGREGNFRGEEPFVSRRTGFLSAAMFAGGSKGALNDGNISPPRHTTVVEGRLFTRCKRL